MQVCRIARQNDMLAMDYTNLMMYKVDEAPKCQLKAMVEIEKEILQTAKAYNKKVREKSFQVGDWYGKLYYLWVPEIENLGSGLRIGRACIRLMAMCRVIRIL
jgi:hypothetical protein